MKPIRFIPLVAMLAVALHPGGCLAAQLPQPEPLLGARSLALSPDGKRIAFCYQGDVWIAPSEGGRASAITRHVEMNDNPVWSPDGKYIAFASNRDGSWDIYVTSAEGGETQRLTYSSGVEIPSDWSPDGTQIAFVATRDAPHPGVYTLDVATGRTRRLFMDIVNLANPRFDKDGASIVYERMANFPWTRPRYCGSGAAQLWRYDLGTGQRTPLAKTGFQHLWPNIGWGGAGVLTVTVGAKTPSSSPMTVDAGKWTDSVERTPNVYWIDAGRPIRQTALVGDAGARFLTVARNAPVAAFENLGDVYLLRRGEAPRKVQIFASTDDKTTLQHHVAAITGETEPILNPKGDTAAFVLHSDIWTVPLVKGKGPNKDDATQLTNWAGLDDQPVWLPDGKSLLFVSDRNDVEQVFKMDLDTKTATPLSKGPGDAFNVQLSPDKKSVGYWEAGRDGGLFVAPLDGGPPKQLINDSNGKQRADLGDAFAWSPDGKYIAYVQRLTGSGFYYWDDKSNILILDVATGAVVNVTQLSANQSAPVFSPDGRYLFFVGNRDGDGIYALPLTQEDAREADLDLKYEKPKTPPVTKIDFDGIADRSRLMLGAHVSGQIQINPNTGDLYFIGDGDLKKAGYDGQGVANLTTGAGVVSFRPADDWSKLIMDRTGQMFTLDLVHPGAPVDVTYRCDYVLNVRDEHLAAFNQLWRTYNREYYDPNFHGRDWLAIRKRYQPLLGSVEHRNEMATVLNEMIGELESSHAEVGPAPGNPQARATSQLGFLIDYSYFGAGVKVAGVPKGSPGSFAKTALRPGDIVTELDGSPISLNEKLWEALNGKDGRDLVLTVVSKPGGPTRTVKYRALSGGEWSALLYKNRIEARRAYVEAKSGGKLSYVHIPGMSEPALNRFKQEAWQYTQGKKGLIIDVRDNGGGNTGDEIIDILERTPHAYYRERDADPVASPGEMLPMPLVVMCAESSYSNAEMYPAAMKDAKLATLVGMPTPGYVIWTYELQLVDGTQARMPSAGSYRLDGTPLEDVGVTPDYEVDITPEEYFAGKDPQLDKAIEVLLAKTK